MNKRCRFFRLNNIFGVWQKTIFFMKQLNVIGVNNIFIDSIFKFDETLNRAMI